MKGWKKKEESIDQRIKEEDKEIIGGREGLKKGVERLKKGKKA